MIVFVSFCFRMNGESFDFSPLALFIYSIKLSSDSVSESDSELD